MFAKCCGLSKAKCPTKCLVALLSSLSDPSLHETLSVTPNIRDVSKSLPQLSSCVLRKTGRLVIWLCGGFLVRSRKSFRCRHTSTAGCSVVTPDMQIVSQPRPLKSGRPCQSDNTKSSSCTSPRREHKQHTFGAACRAHNGAKCSFSRQNPCDRKTGFLPLPRGTHGDRDRHDQHVWKLSTVSDPSKQHTRSLLSLSLSLSLVLRKSQHWEPSRMNFIFPSLRQQQNRPGSAQHSACQDGAKTKRGPTTSEGVMTPISTDTQCIDPPRDRYPSPHLALPRT